MKQSILSTLRWSSALVMMAGSFAVWAASPTLRNIMPRGGQRGGEVDITIAGTHFADAEEVMIYEPGISVAGPITVKGDSTVYAHLKIAATAALGEYHLRVRCASGISELKTFWVGPFPCVYPDPNEPKAQTLNLTQFDTAKPVPFNVTLEGTIQNEQVNYYQVKATKGQRISAEVEALRLGNGNSGGNVFFDPALAILDMNHFELAAADDTALLKQDCFVSAIAPKDGTYVISMRDSSFSGGGDYHYRLHVGDFPRPTMVFPCGGKAGEKIDAQFIGDVRGPISQSLQLPAQPTDEWAVYANQDGKTPPSPNYFRVVDFPNVLPKESNQSFETATATDLPVPFALNGIISLPKKNDFWKFNLKKGEPVEITVYARRLRSPLDSVIVLFDDKGQQLAANDDAGGPDSYLRFTPPNDGAYTLSIRDHLNSGAADYVYRVEVTPVKSAVSITIPPVGQIQVNSQERQTVNVPRGNRYCTLIRAARTNVNGDLNVAMRDLPPGIAMTGEALTPAMEASPVLFEAAPDAPVTGKLCDVYTTAAAPADGAKPDAEAVAAAAKSTYNQRIDLVIGNNQVSFNSTYVKQAAVAVTAAVPFKVDFVDPKVPIVQGGQMNVKVVIERLNGFNKPITVKLLSHPVGVSASTLEIPGDKSEAVMQLGCTESAPLKMGRIVCVATADIKGAAWVSSRLVPLQVAAPYLTGKIQMGSIEQGRSGSVYADLTPATPFQGKAKIALLGLPANVSAAEKEIASDDDNVTFEVTSTEKASAIQTTGLFMQVTVMQNGEPIVHNIAKGGVIRIDPPSKKAPAVAVVKKAPTTAPAKSLTRLEKLRLEQADAPH